MNPVLRFIRSNLPLMQQTRHVYFSIPTKPRHLICFKQWTSEMVMEIIHSAMNLKRCLQDTHGKTLVTLAGSKVMILQEINEPILNMAVSKAATMLGAGDVSITDHLVWEQDYNGRVFSLMSDAIFVATSTHMCVQRFAEQSSVPVICMRSRTHASIQALSTIMAIIETYGQMKGVNVSYLGPPHPVLNSYLLLCPMLGANIRFKCCCDKCPVSPLLFKASEEMCENTKTKSIECRTREEVLKDAGVVIAGPTTCKKDKVQHFTLTMADIQLKTRYNWIFSHICRLPTLLDIQLNTRCNWIFFHTCPRGEEVDDGLFKSIYSRTFVAFDNMQFIAAALLANAIKGHKF